MPWNTAIHQTMTEAEFAAGAIGTSDQGKRIGSDLENHNARLIAVEGTQRADAFGMVPKELPPYGIAATPEWYMKLPVTSGAAGKMGATGETLIDGGLLVPQALADFAWGLFDSKAGDIAIGSYVGTGASGLAIAGIGLQPDALFIMRADNESDGSIMWVTTKDAIATGTGILTCNFTSGGTIQTKTDRVKSLDATGFTINAGAAVEPNVAGVTYWYLAIVDAIADATLNTAIGTYTGDGTANRSISGLGFTPQFVLVVANTTTTSGAAISRELYYTHMVSRSNSGTWTSGLVGGTTSQLVIESDGFKVSSSGTVGVNLNTISYLYIAIKGGAISE